MLWQFLCNFQTFVRESSQMAKSFDLLIPNGVCFIYANTHCYCVIASLCRLLFVKWEFLFIAVWCLQLRICINIFTIPNNMPIYFKSMFVSLIICYFLNIQVCYSTWTKYKTYFLLMNPSPHVFFCHCNAI